MFIKPSIYVFPMNSCSTPFLLVVFLYLSTSVKYIFNETIKNIQHIWEFRSFWLWQHYVSFYHMSLTKEYDIFSIWDKFSPNKYIYFGGLEVNIPSSNHSLYMELVKVWPVKGSYLKPKSDYYCYEHYPSLYIIFHGPFNFFIIVCCIC